MVLMDDTDDTNVSSYTAIPRWKDSLQSTSMTHITIQSQPSIRLSPYVARLESFSAAGVCITCTPSDHGIRQSKDSAAETNHGRQPEKNENNQPADEDI
jgi:hypothetical protein